MSTGRAVATYAVCDAFRYSGKILEISAFFVHLNSAYRYWIVNRVVCVENSFRKGYKPYTCVVWEVDSSEKDVECNVTVMVVRLAGDEKESRMFWG